MSELRVAPFLVLLGEPGIGKSTVLAHEASAEGMAVQTVRDLMTGAQLKIGSPLFIDALDEYRVDGARLDKVHGLGKLLRDAKPSRWRLTCRGEDWHNGSDLPAIRGPTATQPIVLAQLLPLTRDEATAVLASLNEPDPQRFLATAESLGAGSLLESPLSLTLLQKAVSAGANWPTTRNGVFEAAIRRLADEYNPMHQSGPRSGIPKIIEAAAKTALVLLLSGRRAIWRSPGPLPGALTGDNPAYLRADELELDDAVFRDMLDSSLFRGEGEFFEPMHRTVAEYLAGGVLAKVVTGSPSKTAAPLGRVLAMVTGVDRRAPTELRGLYAWFAAHLALNGRQDAAGALIERDAATVLAYGDAAAFPTALRRSILNGLDQDDPYFRAADRQYETVMSGLAGVDLADDFAQILETGADGTHRLLTVFEALTNGRPIPSLQPVLWNIVINPARAEWERRRAGEAWLNGATDRVRELYDAICATPASRDRELLRIHFAATLPPESLTTDEVKSLIVNFISAGQQPNTVGQLISLASALACKPHAELFNVHLKSWLPSNVLLHHSVDLEHFIDCLLAATIRLIPELTAAELWQFANNVREGAWDHLGEESAKALSGWLDATPTRAAELLDVIIVDAYSENSPWMPGNDFAVLTHREVSSSLVRHIFSTACQMPVSDHRNFRLTVAVHMARRLAEGADAVTQDLGHALASTPDFADLLTMLTAPRDSGPSEEVIAQRAAKCEEEAETREKNVGILTSELKSIRAGEHLNALAWAAKLYWQKDNAGHIGGTARITHFSSEAITDAILRGWRQILVRIQAGVSAQTLGQDSAKVTGFEQAALAALDQSRLEAQQDTQATPLAVVIAVLKSAWILHPSALRSDFEHWALHRLNAEPAAGAAQLEEFLTAAIDSGVPHIEALSRLHGEDAHGPAVIEALGAVLTKRRSMAATHLRVAVRAAAKRLSPRRVLDLANAALADPAVTGEQRQIWNFLAFALDPQSHGQQLLDEYGADGGAKAYDEFRAYELEPVSTADPAARSAREGFIVRLIGPTEPPETEEQFLSSGSSNRADMVRRGINVLANYPEAEAGRTIQGLIAMPGLSPWKRDLQHAYAQWQRLYRESTFRFPRPADILGVLTGGPPISPADLLEVVLEELIRLRRELHTTDNTPWKRYWNTDGKGHATEPRAENECRDHLLDRLRDRLERYKIAAALPEARCPEKTRADVLVLSSGGKTLPIEAKRHYHAALWTAPAMQLHAYTQAEGSDGYGIYLVFWFGLNVAKPPGRQDDKALPSTAAQLEAMLVADLPEDLKVQMRIVVFDVSKQ